MIEVQEQASGFLPEGEELAGFMLGVFRLSLATYLMIGIFAFFISDNNRPCGVAFSKKTVVFIAYKKTSISYEPLFVWSINLSELVFEKKLLTHNIKTIKPNMKKTTIQVSNFSMNKQPLLALNALLEVN